MKDRTLRIIVSITALALSISIQIAAQGQGSAKTSQVHYSVVNLGTLGGILGSSAKSINDKGLVAGVANLTGDTVEHAALWRDGVVTDLGTLGGPNSIVLFPVKNNAGLIVGFAQTSIIDPLGETFCYFVCTPTQGPCQGGNPNQPCLAFVWRNGVMKPLGTLGGNNSAALGANNRGLVVGTAENNTQDPASCILPQVLDYKAVTWQGGRIHELPTFPGDAAAVAIAVNDNDQVVGGSGNCGSGPASTIYLHAILWQNDSLTDLGSLGGAMNNLAYALNERGQIVGASDLAGDSTGHAFLWQEGGMTDLGTLTGDFSSVAFGINTRGQVVGQSCNSDFSVCRAFLWQRGVMTDLNTLIPSGSSLSVISGSDINDRGEIVGTALDQSGVPLAFLAVPCDEGHAGDQGCQDAAQSAIGIESLKAVLPESVRKLLQQRMGLVRPLSKSNTKQ